MIEQQVKGLGLTGAQRLDSALLNLRFEAAAAKEQEIADLEAQVQMKKQERDAAYQGLNVDSIKVRDGVEGDVNFGTNHPLYDAMGFTTDDNRQSGLTRKKKTPSGGNA